MNRARRSPPCLSPRRGIGSPVYRSFVSLCSAGPGGAHSGGFSCTFTEDIASDRTNLKAIYPALFVKMLIDAVLFVAPTLIGMWHGKTTAEATPTLGDGSLQALLMLSIITFVALIPFFGFLEIQQALGPEQLRSILLRRRTSGR